MANQQNLKPWKPGQSGNSSGKPKGTVHLATWIRNAMEDEEFTLARKDGSQLRGAPIQAVVTVLINKALEGDMRAFDLLAKYGYGTKLDITTNNEPLPTPILNGQSKSTSLNTQSTS